MPAIKEYPKGAIIYFEGDKSDYIYLLQSGQVVLIYASLDGEKEEKYIVKVGEFFGVKSTLGKYPREETAQVVGGARVVILKPDEFQQLALKNTRLVLQMSKVFSKELRQIHAKIREILKVDNIKDPEYELMNVGESFYMSGNLEHAQYVFEKYLYYYPDGKFKERAEMLLLKARKGETFPIDIPSLESYMTKLMSAYEQEQIRETGLSMVDDELFQMPEVNNEDSLEDSINKMFSINELMEKIEIFVQNNQIKEAYELVIELENSKEYQNNPEAKEFFLYEKGRLLILLKNYKGGLELLLKYLKEYPEGKYTKNALLQIAIVFEILKDFKKAKLFYQKVLMIKPEDELSKQAKKRLELMENK
ncbi:MAG: cAMP-binding protein [Leptospiraceae bacterium]|nr:MAG: cAMP-binding protein [Leptospiraceae bacterium]